LLAKYKNITILSMSFDPDVITGTIDGKEFKTDILSDNQGQYVIIDNQKYYLDQFIVK